MAVAEQIRVAGRRPTCLVVCVFALLAILACDREQPPTLQDYSVPAGPPMSLRETYDHLREWHAKHAYLAMRPYIDSAYHDQVIDLLIAADELLVANTAAQAAIEKVRSGVEAAGFDVAALICDSLELFSRHVQFISQREEGDNGEVTVQIGGDTVLTHINFERRAGHWVYLPGPVGREVIPVIREMAYALNRIASVVSTRPRTREEIEAEYRFRLGPKIKRFTQLAAAAQASEPQTAPVRPQPTSEAETRPG